MQAFGEQLGTPPLASVSHAYCEPSGQDDAPPGSGAHDARSIGHCQLPPCIPTQLAVSPASSASPLPLRSTAPICCACAADAYTASAKATRSEEHTSELPSLK